MTGYKSKKAAARDKVVVTDLDGHVVGQTRKKRSQPANQSDWKDKLIKQHEETILWQAERIAELLDKQPADKPVGQLLEDAFGRGQVMWFKKPEDESMLYTCPQPKAEQQPISDVTEAVTKTVIEVEKLLCEKLGKPWRPAGMSIQTLVDELAQTADKPVAWKVDVDIQNFQGQSEYRTILTWNEKPVWTGTHEINEVLKAVPLYTRPQPATWVGLTDDEMLMIYGQDHVGKKYNLGRMVEEELKRKNT